MRRLFPFAVLILLATIGCVGAVTAARTQPEIQATSRAVPRPATRAVMVLSPSVLADLGVESAVPARGQYEPPTGAVERALFDAGWNPVSKPALVQLATSHKVALSLREVTGRSGSTLVDVAGTLGPASTADGVLLVNGWQTRWLPVLHGRSDAAYMTHLCALTGELEVSYHDRSGRRLWEATVRGRATDLYDLTVVGASGTREVSHPGFACASANDACSDCPTTVDVAAIRTLADHTAKVAVRELTR